MTAHVALYRGMLGLRLYTPLMNCCTAVVFPKDGLSKMVDKLDLAVLIAL